MAATGSAISVLPAPRVSVPRNSNPLPTTDWRSFGAPRNSNPLPTTDWRSFGARIQASTTWCIEDWKAGADQPTSGGPRGGGYEAENPKVLLVYRAPEYPTESRFRVQAGSSPLQTQLPPGGPHTRCVLPYCQSADSRPFPIEDVLIATLFRRSLTFDRRRLGLGSYFELR